MVKKTNNGEENQQRRSLILGNRKQLFALQFEASANTLQTFAKDKKYLNAKLGNISVLHTWGQQLSFHLENADRVAVYFFKKIVQIPYRYTHTLYRKRWWTCK